MRHIHSADRLGRGEALKRAFKEASGCILVYMDVDLATDIPSWRPHRRDTRRSRHRDGLTPSPDSRVKRSTRSSLSIAILQHPHQVLFTPRARPPVRLQGLQAGEPHGYIDEVEDRHWFWDTEVLIRGAKRGSRSSRYPSTGRGEGDEGQAP